MKKNSIIHFSDATMLAIHALTLLTKSKLKNENSFLTTKEMAKILGASENHLAKIMQILVINRYVDSVKGPAGGFILTTNPKEITLKNIIELIEGPIETNFCPFFKNCPLDNCILGPEIKEYSENIIKLLEAQNIKQIAEKSVL